VSKPRYRWATRCKCRDCRCCRILWTCKPRRTSSGQWENTPRGRGRTLYKHECIKRFGRDLRPGQIVRLK